MLKSVYPTFESCIQCVNIATKCHLVMFLSFLIICILGMSVYICMKSFLFTVGGIMSGQAISNS